MDKINIIKTYFLKPYINYKHEIKIKDNISELFIYENNNNNYTLYFYVQNITPYYSYYKIKQIKPNYIIFYSINVNAKRLIRIKNYNYIPINISNYFNRYNYIYDLEFESDLIIKKIDNNIFIKYYKYIYKVKKGLEIYDALEHHFYNSKYNVYKNYITYYINYYIYIYYNNKKYNVKLYNYLYNTIFCNYSRHFMIII